MRRRVVVTGIGAITPLGNDAQTTWKNAKKGMNGIDFIKNLIRDNKTDLTRLEKELQELLDLDPLK